MTEFVGAAAQVRVYLFGHLRVDRGEEMVLLPTRQAKLLLAYLVLHPSSHTREKLAALFWPDVPDASARASLRNTLSILRRQLDPALLLANRETVSLDATFPLWVDALTFQSEASRYLQAPSPDADHGYLQLYKGDLLADFYDDWVLVERDRLHALYLETLLACTQQMRAHSEYERAIAFAERALAGNAASERAHQHLMFCYVALGRRDAALRQYEACRRALEEELAVEPSAATNQLYAWIRRAPVDRVTLEAAITNLPIPPTSFVGREQQMAALKRRLEAVRLLTLTGAGGSGKSRLAIQVAMDLLEAYKDGVWWVELAPLADPDLVAQAAAKALGVPEVPN